MQRLPQDDGELNQAAAELAKNRNLSGVCLHVLWNLIQQYRERAHHGFQSVAGFGGRGGERMGSIEMAALNVVHAQGEYCELWHNDGMSPEMSAAVAKAWEEAKQLGYDAYKKKLMSEGKYRER